MIQGGGEEKKTKQAVARGQGLTGRRGSVTRVEEAKSPD